MVSTVGLSMLHWSSTTTNEAIDYIDITIYQLNPTIAEPLYSSIIVFLFMLIIEQSILLIDRYSRMRMERWKQNLCTLYASLIVSNNQWNNKHFWNSIFLISLTLIMILIAWYDWCWAEWRDLLDGLLTKICFTNHYYIINEAQCSM